jgi:hypothetical protein
MANPEDLKVVGKGAPATAAWSKRNPSGQLDLLGANLSGAHLRGANLRGADLEKCQCDSTVFAAVDVSDVRGLHAARHSGPSTIGVDTLFKSKGKIPEVFLRGAGVPDVLIQYVGTLTGAALEFYTCFISFMESDGAFSTRLNSDLQAAGMRCWRWKEKAKWGSTLMRQVDDAIRVYDKLIVILSEASVKAEPVVHEIERALQKEQRDGRDVLFPIRVDDAVYSWKHALQANVVRKVIRDFREWQDPTKYEAALKRLIGDLRAERKPA